MGFSGSVGVTLVLLLDPRTDGRIVIDFKDGVLGNSVSNGVSGLGNFPLWLILGVLDAKAAGKGGGFAEDCTTDVFARLRIEEVSTEMLVFSLPKDCEWDLPVVGVGAWGRSSGLVFAEDVLDRPGRKTASDRVGVVSSTRSDLSPALFFGLGLIPASMDVLELKGSVSLIVIDDSDDWDETSF